VVHTCRLTAGWAGVLLLHRGLALPPQGQGRGCGCAHVSSRLLHVLYAIHMQQTAKRRSCRDDQHNEYTGGALVQLLLLLALLACRSLCCCWAQVQSTGAAVIDACQVVASTAGWRNSTQLLWCSQLCTFGVLPAANPTHVMLASRKGWARVAPHCGGTGRASLLRLATHRWIRPCGSSHLNVR
jgi:hypothetical protein